METSLTSPFALLRQAWSLALARNHVTLYLIVGSLPQVVSVLIGYLAGRTNVQSGIVDLAYNTNRWGIAGLIATGLIVISLVSAWYTALLYMVYKATVSGTVGALTTYFRPAKSVTIRLLVTYLKIGIITFLGFLLLIVPGFIFAVRSMFAPLIASLEDGSAKPIDQSKRLVKGRFWKLVGRGILLVACYNIPLSVLQSIHPILGSIWAVTSPVFGLYFFLVYTDFKKTAAVAS